MMKKIIFLLFICCSFNGCKLSKIYYSLSGANIPQGMETFSVDYFTNRTPFVPNLSSEFTEDLKAYLRNKTSLQEVTDNNGDGRFEGEIVEFSQRPINIQSDEIAAGNRLTIRIRVKYTNTIDDVGSFSQDFSYYEDYSIDDDYDSIEADMVKNITEKIIEDVFNKAFVNW